MPTKPKILMVLLLLAGSFAFAAPATDLPFLAWKRACHEPILSPQGAAWESAGTFNPAVTFFRAKDAKKQDVAKFVILYRAQDTAGTSHLGYAESTDGIHFARRPQPALSCPKRSTASIGCTGSAPLRTRLTRWGFPTPTM